MKKLLCLLAVTFGMTTMLSAQGDSFEGPLGYLTKLQKGKTCRISSARPERSSNSDNYNVAPGETHLLADIQGSGSIRHIWLTFPAAMPKTENSPGMASHDELVIRMYWDGAKEPAVEAPVGDFFACGFGRRMSVNSLPVLVEGGDSYNCFWIMPFYKSARIEIENQSDRPTNLYYYVDYQIDEQHPEKTPYFCAQYRQEFPTASGRDYLILDAEGEGHYVGTVMNIRSRSPEWFGEGDEKFFIDGDKKPTIQGTGTEDYAMHAYGLSAPTSYAYCGAPNEEGKFDQVGWIMNYYRWHIADPVSFTKSLRFEIENVGWISKDELAPGEPEWNAERNDDFSTVAFWYQVGQPKRFTKLPSAAERKLPEIDLIVEGETLIKNARYSDGVEPTLQAGYGFTGNGQVFFPNQLPDNGKDAFIEMDFDLQKAERRQLTLRYTKSFDFGIYDVYFDGELVAENLDMYSPWTKTDELSLGSRDFTPGTHTLRFVCKGRNSASVGSFLGFDSVRLRERWNKKRTAPADLY